MKKKIKEMRYFPVHVSNFFLQNTQLPFMNRNPYHFRRGENEEGKIKKKTSNFILKKTTIFLSQNLL